MSNPYNRRKLSNEKWPPASQILEEFPTMFRFFEQHSDIKQQYIKYKTVEILNERYGKR